MTVAGPAVYLLGESLVRLRMISSLSPQRLVAVLVLGLLGALARSLPALGLLAGVAAVLLALAVWDHERLRPRSGPFAWVDVHRQARIDHSG
jgi:apolipoprotein N-acyltransferase